ncbi:MAG: hypothetical protein JHD31_05165 [Rhodoluna sp.]|nr:hypothetical protein [Rhodoluna sp.]
MNRTCKSSESSFDAICLLLAVELNGITEPMANGAFAPTRILGVSGLNCFRADWILLVEGIPTLTIVTGCPGG